MKKLFYVLCLFVVSIVVQHAYAQGSCLKITKTVTRGTDCKYLLHLDIENPTSGKKSFTVTNGTSVTDVVNVDDGEITVFEKEYEVAGCDLSMLKITIYTAPDAGGTDCASLTALPIRLQDFRLNKTEKTITLQWQAAQASIEQNSSFTIERSFNGRDFVPIAVIPATQLQTVYSYSDVPRISGAVFYRILADGKYSQIVSTTFSHSAVQLGISPSTLIVVAPDHMYFTEYRISNMLGQIVSHGNKPTIPIDHLLKGQYILQCFSKEAAPYMIKFQKQ